MIPSYQPVEIKEDHEAWSKFSRGPYRWYFNKLEIALRQGLDAGPAATAPGKAGEYIHRPIYNIYGMGLGARKFSYDPYADEENILNNKIVPEGHFWTQWLNGRHLSIDYRRSVTSSDRWVVSTAVQGFHESDADLTKFAFWKVIDPVEVPQLEELALKMEFANEPGVLGFNVELRAETVTEVHFRLGNEHFADCPIGTKILPVWEGHEEPEGQWRDNPPSVIDFSKSNDLSVVRKGFKLQFPTG